MTDPYAMKFPSKPPPSLVPTKNWHLQYLADHMRPDEQSHWLAFSGAETYNPDTAAAGMIATPGIKFTLLGKDGMPVIAGSFYEERKGAWAGWMVGTLDGWATDWRGITKTARWYIGQLFRMGARRVSVTTIASRTCAIDWYRRALGMSLEGTFRKAGAHGEDVVCYALVSGGDV